MFNFRPRHDDEDWTDNPVSNAMAYLSQRFTPNWCKDAEHWTIRWTNLLWADCPCCLSIRFFIVGTIPGFAAGALVAALVAAFI